MFIKDLKEQFIGRIVRQGEKLELIKNEEQRDKKLNIVEEIEAFTSL